MITVFLQATGDMMPTLLMFGVFFVFMYFVMIRPQMTRQKKEKQFQESLKVGSRVVTTSGLHGRVAQIQEDGIVIETLSGKLKFEKAAISREFTLNRFPEANEEKK
ncbi:preprotein translocase subunit YajC [Bergeyella sp. RCAD1439]|uniref:preprotein translocase subunit YajC n=1 Tax=Bergeyella anatis TaxID=3113737 RepID=UPI002E1847DA|nr:preprotein translocase subunit YajC [Bergeyella sp. RCAD1439]